MSSKIEWTNETWNPVIGCTRVSAGCQNCYAERQSARLAFMADADEVKGKPPAPRKYEYTRVVKYKNGYPLPQWNNRVVCVEKALADPMKWRKPRMIFVNSMSDLFHPDVPFGFIDEVFGVMAIARQHTFQILTKRPDRMERYCTSRMDESGVWDQLLYEGRYPWPIGATQAQIEAGDEWMAENPSLPNVWLGTSAEDQATANERIPHLLRCPASVRFLSCEPLLGSVELPRRDDDGGDIPPSDRREWGFPPRTISTWDAPAESQIDWVIIGGESGPGARPFDVCWAENLIEAATDADVPVFVKQMGAAPFISNPINGPIKWRGNLHLKSRKGDDPAEWPAHLRRREFPLVSPRQTKRPSISPHPF